MIFAAARQESLFGVKIERAILVTAVASATLFAGAVTWANIHNLDIGLVSKRSIDEYFFILVLSRMFEGMLSLDPRNFFNISFFSYGFPYFFLQMVLTIPAQLAHSYEAMLIIARSFSLAWALGALALSAWWIRRRTGSWVYALLAVWLMIAMPGFVHMTTIMHPDTMMNFFLLTAFVAAAELEPARRRDVVIVGLLCGLGACAKIQIVIYIPFVAMLLGARVLMAHSGPDNLRARLVPAAGAVGAVGLLTPVTYLVLNPFLVRGEALHAFIHDFRQNMESNATNHFTYVLPTAADKLHMLMQSYVPVPVLVVVAAALVVVAAWRRYPFSKLLPELSMLAAGALSCVYVFVGVEKTWDSYYLPSFILLTVSLISLGGRIAPRGARLQVGLGAALAIALALFALRTPVAIAAPIVDDGPEARESVPIVFLVAGPLKQIADPHIMISSFTPFQFQKLGLRITQVIYVSGALNAEQMDKANILVIRKNDIYFEPVLLARKGPAGAELRQSRKRIDTMRAGKDNDFLLCAENVTALVFCRRSVYVLARP